MGMYIMIANMVNNPVEDNRGSLALNMMIYGVVIYIIQLNKYEPVEKTNTSSYEKIFEDDVSTAVTNC
tara:strand:+ start:608 stop:811 length:204 start_codon:yes stop_codon:yes gene_type:complete